MLLAFITATENVVHANFRNTLKMHFNKNIVQGYFLLIWCDGSCISQPLFSGHLSQRDPIKKKPTMHDVLDMDTLVALHPLPALSSSPMTFWEITPISFIGPQLWAEETPPLAPEVGK